MSDIAGKPIRGESSELTVNAFRPNDLNQACRARLSRCLVNVSALSKARFHRSVKSGAVLCARSIEPFEGGRWRLAVEAG